ncbi:MAG: NAD(P)/FAD-dependent oxidoreductase [Candidatus Omnitrophota bacterium]
MGFKLLELKMMPGFSPDDLKAKIAKTLRLNLAEISYTIEKQSLDARDKSFIHWKIRVGVSSPALKGAAAPAEPLLRIPYQKRNKKVVVVGSGPAGFFAGYVLQSAGFEVTIIEQGARVETRAHEIAKFEGSGVLNERSNYAFGEGGAGTFSDGKLTSRTKTISAERKFITDTYIQAGAPNEIAYLSHPHLGSDRLRKIVPTLGRQFGEKGGTLRFDTKVVNIDIDTANGHVRSVDTEKGKIDGDYFIFAIGHSSYDTFRMMIKNGIPFEVKAFAIGCRVEHRQEVINLSQWGKATLPGLNAAEYRLTFSETIQETFHELSPASVYSFCMCPGGKIVPAAVVPHTSIVNGMSHYARAGMYANAAIAVGLDPNRLLGREMDALEALDWLETLERKFFDFTGSYAAPACKINDFIEGKTAGSDVSVEGTSYPMGLVSADFNLLFPRPIATALKAGMKDFCRKIKGFEEGMMIGLESKTSSPIRAVREKSGKSEAADNLYIVGEGSGFAGGIVSSGADGVKAALHILHLFPDSV